MDSGDGFALPPPWTFKFVRCAKYCFNILCTVANVDFLEASFIRHNTKLPRQLEAQKAATEYAREKEERQNNSAEQSHFSFAQRVSHGRRRWCGCLEAVLCLLILFQR